jgi:hypothetical protein
MADNVHITDVELEAMHKQGACLTRHQQREEGNLCSHQWQAYQQSLDHASTYDYPTYIELCEKSSNKVSYFYPSATSTRSKRPRPGDWDVGVGQNFQHFRVPYWHNCHHVVPNGVLRDAITDAGNSDARLPNLIKYALLKAEYNLNDKENMVILPMQSVVAKALGLPRHLKGDELGPGEKAEMFSHPDYSARVKQKLVPIVNDYKRIILDALNKKHPALPGPVSKSKLERLSMSTYIDIITFGSSKKFSGESLADVPIS